VTKDIFQILGRKSLAFLEEFGQIFLLLFRIIKNFKNIHRTRKQILYQMEHIGVDSLPLVIIISIFTGAVAAWQAAYQLKGIAPLSLLGGTTSRAIITELGPVLTGIVIAGRVGASIAAELGTMKVTEQIDALEIMGVNSASYLILPKIIATLVFNPFLTLISISVGIVGGWLAGTSAGVVTSEDYIYGIQYSFIPYYVTYAIIKTLVFAFIITTVSAFHGYKVEGGSLEVGQASTKAVVHSSILILLFNVILTQLLLS